VVQIASFSVSFFLFFNKVGIGDTNNLIFFTKKKKVIISVQ